MLKGDINNPGKITINGFLIAVEIEEGTSIEQVGNKLADAVSFMEGTGQVEVNHLGTLELVPEDSEGAMQIFEGEGNTTTVKES